MNTTCYEHRATAQRNVRLARIANVASRVHLRSETVGRGTTGNAMCMCAGSIRSKTAHRVIAAGSREGDGEDGMSQARANRHSRALPVAGGRAAGHRAAHAVHQPATSQHLEDVIGVPALHIYASARASLAYSYSCIDMQPVCHYVKYG